MKLFMNMIPAHTSTQTRLLHRRSLSHATLFGALSLAAVCSAAAQSNSVLPEYQPAEKVTGLIRSWGSDQMGPLMKNWEEGFRRYQPGVVFFDTLKGTATAQFGLQESVADLAVTARKIYPYEFYGIYRRSLLYPVEIAVATGSYNAPGKSTALGVFVNKDNPLSKLTMKQLDGIFGAHRTGGWQDLNWHEEVARGADQDIRTWGQLGLTGEWANQPIHVYGPPGIYPGGISFFQMRVFGGADSWNETLREFDDRKQMMAALSADRYGIAYTPRFNQTAQVKPLALAQTAAGPFVELSRDNVQNRSYPLSRLAYIYFAPDQPNGAAAMLDPKIREFLRYILSRQGQEDVRREGDYLPLTVGVAEEQRHKIQ